MKTVGFITNIDKDPTLSHTANLVNWVIEKGCRVLVTNIIYNRIKIGEPTASTDEIYLKADFVVVLGGDGTILRVARKAARYGAPILGINFGTLGYLADVERNDAIEALTKVLDGNYKVEKRMMIEAFLERGCISHDVNIALNEICITNLAFSRMITLNISINNEYVDTVRADGIIISTPTGSTAYNLSAGGPILNPQTKLMTITHICPHTLYSRPLVVSGDDEVKIQVAGDYNSVQVTCDGQNCIPLKDGDVVVIKKSSYYTNIIKTTNMNFYDILRRKMVEVRK
ncbi:MAG: NAD(+)/NADH kinase [Lachnospirales bacterium]